MTTNNPQRAVAWWLFACCAMVFLTMVVGGVTRTVDDDDPTVREALVEGEGRLAEDRQARAADDLVRRSRGWR